MILSDATLAGMASSTADCVYCISVLEHIPDAEKAIKEIARILKPNGLFLLTFDVDLNGNFEVGPPTYSSLMESLEFYFRPVHRTRVVHPRRMLTSDNVRIRPYRLHSLRALRGMVREALAIPYRFALGRRPLHPGRVVVSSFGAVLAKRL